MTISPSNNVLQHYLLSVNKEQPKKSNKVSSSVKPKVTSNKESLACCEEQMFEKIGTNTNRLENIYSQLTLSQTHFIQEILLQSKATFIDYTQLVHALANKLQLNPLSIKCELSRLAELNIILLEELQWQGKLLKINPLILKRVIGERIHTDQQIKINEMPYAQCNLPFHVNLLPFEKQLLFFMFELKRKTLLSNQFLTKSQQADLRSKYLSINALLTSLEHLTLEHKQSNIHDDQLIASCDDKVVRFILYIASELHLIQYDDNSLIWNEEQWLRFLAISCEEQKLILQLVISHFAERYLKHIEYDMFLMLLYASQHWTVSSEHLQLPLIQFVCTFGWIDVVNLNNKMYIKHKERHDEKKSFPIVLPPFQLMCLPDCDSLAIWNLIPITECDAYTEIIRLDVTVHSIQHALTLGYTEQQIEQILAVENNSTIKAYLSRLMALAQQQQLTPGESHHDDYKQNNKKSTALPRRVTLLDQLIKQFTQVQGKHQFIQQDIQHTESHLADLAARWFSKLQHYNLTTKRVIVEQAIENGISLEVEMSESIIRVIPKCIKRSGEDYIVDYMVEAEADKALVNHLDCTPLTSIGKLRLCR